LDDEIPNIWKVIKAMFQTTNQSMIVIYHLDSEWQFTIWGIYSRWIQTWHKQHRLQSISDCSPGGKSSPELLAQWPCNRNQFIGGTYYLPYIRPMFQAYGREYPHTIWSCMVRYLHFRILKFPLNCLPESSSPVPTLLDLCPIPGSHSSGGLITRQIQCGSIQKGCYTQLLVIDIYCTIILGI